MAKGLMYINPKIRACKICRGSFTPFKTTDVTCSFGCAAEWRRQKALKRERSEKRREQRAGRMRLRTASDWTKLAQAEFNRFVRMRDEKLPCISCGRSTGSKRNAGHYLSVGSHPELRFNEDNCHSQCEHCNSWQSGNAVAYRLALVRKIGLTRVEALEGPHEPVRYRKDDLISIRNKYRRKCQELRAISSKVEHCASNAAVGVQVSGGAP